MHKKRDYGQNPWVRLGFWLGLLLLLFGYALYARQLAANSDATKAEAAGHPAVSVVRAWAVPKDQPIDRVKQATDGHWQLLEIRQPTRMDRIGHATYCCTHGHVAGSAHYLLVLFGRDTRHWSDGIFRTRASSIATPRSRSTSNPSRAARWAATT